MESHSFSVAHAQKYGVECATLLNFFVYWIRVNKTLGKNFREEKTWVYHTQRDLVAIYPYWNCKTIERYLAKLIDFGVLVKKKFNHNRWNQTNWYAFANEDEFLCDFSKNVAHATKMTHREDESVACINNTHEYKTIEKQQAAKGAKAPAAAPLAKANLAKAKVPDKPKPKIYECFDSFLANGPLPLAVKDLEWATRTHSEEDCKNALQWALDNKEKVKTTFPQFFKGALKNRPWEDEIRPSKKKNPLVSQPSPEEMNRELANRYDRMNEGEWFIVTTYDWVTFANRKDPDKRIIIAFDDPRFKKHFFDTLEKLKFEILEE